MNTLGENINLENDLVLLRPLNIDDFDALFAIASDPLIWEQHPQPDRYKKEVFQTFFDGALKSKAAFMIYNKADKELMGSSRYYDYEAEKQKVAIGFTFITRKYWGGKYNNSIKTLMLDYAFQFVEQVDFHIGMQNFRSQKAVEKLGATMVEESNGGLTYVLPKVVFLRSV